MLPAAYAIVISLPFIREAGQTLLQGKQARCRTYILILGRTISIMSTILYLGELIMVKLEYEGIFPERGGAGGI